MSKKRSDCARPRSIDALFRELGNELLIYDTRTHRGHCLNKSAAAVWKACDGKATVSGIVVELRAKGHSGMNEEIAWMTLRKLDKAGLLVEGTFTESDGCALSRREIIRRMGKIAAIALPVVTSMIVPAPASALSCFPLLHTCSSNAECCSGHCGLSGVTLVCLP